MILLWGLPGDTPIAHVQQALIRLGCASIFLDERDALETHVRLSGADASDGVLRARHFVIDLAQITAVYQRPYGVDRIPALAGHPHGDDAWRHSQDVADSLSSWMETCSALVVNPPSAMASNGSKPYQARIIAASGLRVPETLVTTDPEAVHEFRARHGELIYKSTSGVRSIVSRMSDDKWEQLPLGALVSHAVPGVRRRH